MTFLFFCFFSFWLCDSFACWWKIDVNHSPWLLSNIHSLYTLYSSVPIYSVTLSFSHSDSPPLLPVFTSLFLPNVSLFSHYSNNKNKNVPVLSYSLCTSRFWVLLMPMLPDTFPHPPLLFEGTLSSLCDVIVYESHVTRAEQEIIDRNGVQTGKWGAGKGISTLPVMFLEVCHPLAVIINLEYLWNLCVHCLGHCTL